MKPWVLVAIFAALAGALVAALLLRAPAVRATPDAAIPAALDGAVDRPPAAAAPADNLLAEWPLRGHARVPAGQRLQLAPAETVADVAFTADGAAALLVLTRGDHGRLARWPYDQAVEELSGLEARPVEVEVSAFDGAAYLILQAADEWRLERARVAGGTLVERTVVYRSPEPLSSLVCPALLWDGQERCFFAREHAPGKTQVIGVRASGRAAYELTSPGGRLGERTDPALRARKDDEGEQPPAVQRLESARPLSFDAGDGTVFLADGAGRLLALGYDGGNWSAPSAIPEPAGGSLLHTPNAYFRVRWRPTEDGAALVDPAGAVAERLAPGRRLLRPPLLDPTGRVFLALTPGSGGQVLETVAVAHPLAAVRWLAHVQPAVRAELAARGFSAAGTRHEQLYQWYEEQAYAYPATVPIFASIDGMLEVLNAGFQASFMLLERELSRPRLEALAGALAQAGERQGQARLAAIGEETRRMLQGDFASGEGRKVLAEQRAPSALHTVPKAEEIDFGDFHPRGSYTSSPELAHYFRAFKYFNLLVLTDAERDGLKADPAFVSALDAWVQVQEPFVWPSRQSGDLLGRPAALPAYLREECVPRRVRTAPPRPFPLGFGVDGEILEATVSRLGVAADCTTRNVPPFRKLPDGRDLLVGLGSEEARRRAAPEYTSFPELGAVHAQLARRFGRDVALAAGDAPRGRFARQWLRLVQLLASDDVVPEGVSADVWRARLLETALASWVGFRHTTVLVTEASAAEMGGGFVGFEELSVEPDRGAVDPLPEAWGELARMLDVLAPLAEPAERGVARELRAVAGAARRFQEMARRQRAGEPLSRADYEAIAGYGAAIEHPYLKLQSALTPNQGLNGPDPMMKIVDIQTWLDDETGELLVWHAAVGRPRAVVVLLGDRGLLTPAHGAVYAYHEVVEGRRLDDAEWRKRVDLTPRPRWLGGATSTAAAR